MLCRKCKKEIPDNSIYCNFCGTKQTDERYKESFENPSDFINISFMTDEEKSDFRNLSKTITTNI